MKIFENFINEILTKKAIEYALEKLNNSDL